MSNLKKMINFLIKKVAIVLINFSRLTINIKSIEQCAEMIAHDFHCLSNC